MTLRDTHTKLCHFNNGVCCGYDSKTKSRPASIIISFSLFPHKNNKLVELHVLAGENGYHSCPLVTSHKRAEHTANKKMQHSCGVTYSIALAYQFQNTTILVNLFQLH